MEIVKRGAEAVLYRDVYDGQSVLIKDRIKKGYRIREIDDAIRKTRTRKEVKLLTEARKCGVSTPAVLDVEENRIIMQFVDGKRLKELLNSEDEKTVSKVCTELGKAIGKLHAYGIIHGDLTTSNMILSDGKIYLIDFGLSEFSKRIEDQGVDLNLLFEALKSTHFKILKLCWDNIIKGYKQEYKKADDVIKKVDEIEKRARYAER